MPTQTEHIFSIQLLADDADRINIEPAFGCVFSQMTGASLFGEVQNTYSEEYPERSGVRLYVPQKPTYKPVEVTLTLLFNGDDPLADSAAFYDYVAGKKVQWHDTFRGKYLALLLTKTPSVERELLYGERKYQLIKYTFSNFMGYPSDAAFVFPGALKDERP